MIVWPEDKHLTSTARDNLERFKATGASKALESDAQQWTFQSWARMPDPPCHMILVSDAGESASVTIEDNGVWNMSKQSVR